MFMLFTASMILMVPRFYAIILDEMREKQKKRQTTHTPSGKSSVYMLKNEMNKEKT